MKTLILPGISRSNKEWANEAKIELEAKGLDITTIDWEHWKIGDHENIFTTKDSQSVLTEIGTDQVNIIAKSYGTYVLVQILQQLGIQINKLILCGIPLNDLKPGDPENINHSQI